jgi:hypothetical protein
VPPAKARAAARTTYLLGHKHFRAGRYGLALSAFECAQKMVPARLARYWIARSAEAARRYRLALRVYRGLLTAPPAGIKAAEIERRIAWLEKKIRPKPRPPDVRPVPPIPKKPDEPAPKRDKKKLMRGFAWATTSVGVALLIASAALLGQAAVDKSKIEGAEPEHGTYWDPDLKKRYNRRDALLAGGWVSFGAGVAAAVVGTTLFVLGREKEKATAVSVSPTNRGAYVGVTLGF